MFARLGCLFVLVPLLELALLIQVGQWVGVLPTVLLVAGTGLVGAWLARSQGIQALARVQSEMERGAMPGQALMDGAAILVGGAFLMTPGVVTDVLGFALLVPVTRGWMKRWATKRLKRNMEQGLQSGRIRVTMMGGRPFGGGDGPDGRAGSDGDGDDPDEPRPPRPGEIVQ